MPSAASEIHRLRRWNRAKRKCACPRRRCYREALTDKRFLLELARWRCAWRVSLLKDPTDFVRAAGAWPPLF
jgi:hypothetical protein